MAGVEARMSNPELVLHVPHDPQEVDELLVRSVEWLVSDPGNSSGKAGVYGLDQVDQGVSYSPSGNEVELTGTYFGKHETYSPNGKPAGVADSVKVLDYDLPDFYGGRNSPISDKIPLVPGTNEVDRVALGQKSEEVRRRMASTIIKTLDGTGKHKELYAILSQ